MKEFKGTRGNIVLRGKTDIIDYYISSGTKIICYSGSSNETDKINMNLIVDAFKVRQQINCQLTDLLENFNSAISLLKQTTEYEVLQSFRDKVSILEKVKDNE